MLKAVFHRNGDDFCERFSEHFSGFEISGHAGYGTEGNDIVCAAVSSCTMLVCNAVTENFKADAEVKVEENRITLRLRKYDKSAAELIAALYEHIKAISEDYGKVKVEIG